MGRGDGQAAGYWVGRRGVVDPDWIVWAREIQAIAQTGLAFEPNEYDRDRYHRLRDLAAQMMAAHSETDVDALRAMFAAEWGYATPKSGVRAAVFRDGRILLVRETADDNRWTMPGGWSEVGMTPSENIVKEVLEETGFEVRVVKLAAVFDRTRHEHPPAPFHEYRKFFLCEITGGMAAASAETSEIAFFAENELPEDLSLERTTMAQLRLMFAHHRDPGRPTDFD